MAGMNEPLPPADALRKRRVWNWWYLLFLVESAVALWPPLYNKAEPHLLGVPFFYWFQLVWVFAAAALTAIVYFCTDD